MFDSSFVAYHMRQDRWILMQEFEHWHDIPVSELKEQDLIFNHNKSDLVLTLEPLLEHFGFFRPYLLNEWLYAWHLLYDLSSQAFCS